MTHLTAASGTPYPHERCRSQNTTHRAGAGSVREAV